MKISTLQILTGRKFDGKKCLQRRRIERDSANRGQPYQENAWSGKGKAVSSPDELVCELFDDFIEQFLKSPDAGLSVHQKIGTEPNEKLDAYANLQGTWPDPFNVSDQPKETTGYPTKLPLNP